MYYVLAYQEKGNYPGVLLNNNLNITMKLHNKFEVCMFELTC